VKQYYFISGLPRSGSTLLSAILRQNPDFYADIASPIEAITGGAIDIISQSENIFIENNQRKNLCYGIFEGYYQHIDNPIIFDSSRWWTGKTNFLQSLFPYTKIICMVRDVVSILNSFEVIFNKNHFYTKQINDKVFSHNIFVRTDELFERELRNPLSLLQEGYNNNPKMIKLIEYEDLCKEPEKTVREIYNFIKKPYFSHNFEHVEYSNENFDMTCKVKDLHTVRNKVEYKPPKIVLPPKICKEFREKNLEFWRVNDSNHKKDFRYQ